MSSYCIKEKKITEEVNPKYVLTKNGRMMRKSTSASCGITKTKSIKKDGGAVDIHKAMLPLLPKNGLTLPGCKYCGPGNPLDLGKHLINDGICMKHNYCYSNGIPKSVYNKEILKDLEKTRVKHLAKRLQRINSETCYRNKI